MNIYVYQLVQNLLELHSPCSKLQLPVSVVISETLDSGDDCDADEVFKPPWRLKTRLTHWNEV